MNKDLIKVVKRNKKDKMEITQILNSTAAESNTQLNLTSAVKNWIAERRENSRLEKVFSERNLLAWKRKSENLNEITS